MAWTKIEYTREQVNVAGNILIGNKTVDNVIAENAAYQIINNWRTAHNFPLNTFQARLRKKANEVNNNCLVVQRIKRLASIKLKLERYKKMKLSQIQDIGGCRAIMKTISDVNKLVKLYLHESKGVKHKLASEDNYINNPKPSGYRGVHLVYKYQSGRNQHYQDLKIEIQIRTVLQHAWATAVETVGAFTAQSLKSSQGEKDWLQFFKLMGSAMAIKENSPIIPDTPKNLTDLKREISKYESKLKVKKHLKAFSLSLSILDDDKLDMPDAYYYLL